MSDQEEEKERKLERKVRTRVCPQFNGEREKFKQWRSKVEDWYETDGQYLEYPGLEVRQAVEGKAYEAVEDIDRRKLKESNGFQTILMNLDKIYKKDEKMERYDKTKAYYNIKQSHGESVSDYLNRFEKVRREWKMLKGSQEEDEGIFLLGTMRLNDNDHHVIAGACQDDFKYDNVWRKLKNIMGERENHEKEKIWWNSKEEKQENRVEGKRNPINKKGNISKCMNCRSEFHFAKQCPKEKKCFVCGSGDHFGRDCEKNYYNMNRNKREEESKKSEATKEGRKEKFTAMSSGGWWTDEIEDCEAILDTGCPKSVCGDR